MLCPAPSLAGPSGARRPGRAPAPPACGEMRQQGTRSGEPIERRDLIFVPLGPGSAAPLFPYLEYLLVFHLLCGSINATRSTPEELVSCLNRKTPRAKWLACCVAGLRSVRGGLGA